MDTTTLHRSLIVSLYAILITPLVFFNDLFFPYITGKGFYFRLLIQIAVALYVALILQDRSYLPKKSAVVWSVLAFVGILVLATFTSENPARSFWSNYERMEGLVLMLHLAAYAVIAACVLNTKVLWSRFWHMSLWVSVVMGLRSMLDLFDPTTGAFRNFRIYGTLGNSSYLGVYALLHIFLAGFFLIRYKKDRMWNVFYIGTMMFNGFVMYWTGTRSAFVGLVVGILVAAAGIAVYEKKEKTVRKIGIGAIVATIVIVGFFGAIKNTAFIKQYPTVDRYASLISFDVKKIFQDQGYGRTLLWGVAWKGVQERPLLGWGQDNFNYVFAKYYNPAMYGQEEWFDRAHNVFLDWLIAAGFLGLISYLALSVIMIVRIINIPEDAMSVAQKSVFVGMLVAYGVHNLFVFDHLVSYVLFFGFIGYIYYLSLPEVPKEDHSTLIASSGQRYAVITLVSVAMLIVVYVVSLKPLSANSYLIDALRSQGESTSQAAENTFVAFQQALASNTFGRGEIREQLAVATQGSLRQNAEVFAKIVPFAIEQMTDEARRAPGDPRYQYFLAVIYNSLGQYDNGLRAVRAAEALSSQKQGFILVEMEMLMRQNKLEEALAVAERAYNLDTTYRKAALWYIAMAVRAGQYNRVASVLEKHPNAIIDPVVMESYVVSKQLPRTRLLLEKYIAQDPTAPLEARFYLAAAQLEAGNRTKALAILTELRTSITDQVSSAQINELIDLINKGATSLIR